MKRKIPILISLCCLLAATGAWVNGQPKVSDKNKVGDFRSISRTEIEMLLSEVAKTNPTVLKRLAEDPEMKKQQIENLRQLLAFASQAQRDGLASEPTNRQELESIRAEVLAVNYDREINKNKGPMPPFAFITDAQVKAYWSTETQRTHESEFNDFFNAKIAILRASSPEKKDREISDDEKKQARDVFAKIRIYKAEFDQKNQSGELTKEFVDKANLQVKLQQAQFLARLYSEKIADRTEVSDADVAKYIAAHPEFDLTEKKAKAQKILERAKAGESFAALANEFTEDPGNNGPNGEAHGGLYKDVPKGRMVAPFEAAALALQPGQISPELVETDFGFHIIKLDRKTTAKDGPGSETYDVRHILISTSYKDSDDPTARETPVKDYVRSKLEKENDKKLTDEIVAANNIQVPDDFTVPEVKGEPPPKAVKKAHVVKKRPVKKRR